MAVSTVSTALQIRSAFCAEPEPERMRYSSAMNTWQAAVHSV
jgi:hypothetical protein